MCNLQVSNVQMDDVLERVLDLAAAQRDIMVIVRNSLLFSLLPGNFAMQTVEAKEGEHD
jgi:hypothetical protein